jgi:hypothetical protein
MRRWVLGLAVAFAAAGVATADEKVEAVVKKGIEAHGGADALNKYKAARSKMKGDMSVMGMEFEFTGTMAYSMPDRYKVEIDAEIMGMKLHVTQIVRGESVKNTVMVGGMTIPVNGDAEKEELKLALAIQEAGQLTTLLDAKKFTVKAGDDEDVNGKKASVLLVTPAVVKKEVKLFFDKTSGLLVKTAHKGKGAGEGAEEVLEEAYHSEYKKIKGLQVSTKMSVTHDGKKFMNIEVSDIEVSEKIDDKEFTIDD